MKTKLTLSIDEGIVNRARRLSKKHRKSVSMLFEEFIRQQDKMQLSSGKDTITDSLIGILHDPGVSYTSMKKEYHQSRIKKQKHA